MTKSLFETQLERRILIMDGAMGTMLQQAELTAEDFGGDEYEGCNEYLNETAPHVIEKIHYDYLKAGADIIETNSFGSTDLVLDDYDLGFKAEELSFQAAALAKKVADQFSTTEWPRFVAGAMGPTTKSLSVTGGTTFEALIDSYFIQARGLIRGGSDLILLETSQDMRNVKAAFIGIEKAFKELAVKLPLMVSGTIEPMGTTLAGQNIEAFYLSLEHMKPVVVGLNCATGPEFMRDHIRSLSELSTGYVSCYPNAGLPDEEGHYHESPESLAKKLAGFAEKGWLNVVGGCCGTTPAHIQQLRSELLKYEPRKLNDGHAHAVSGIEPLLYDESMRPLFVGERTNVIGSRKFKRLIAEGKYEEASEIARAQVKRGAHVIDVCLADPDREEKEDVEEFLKFLVNKVKVPLMIDSTDEEVIETALTYSQGKAIINSINLEDGEERFEKIAPLVHKYGAAVVVGTIDEEGMAVSAKRKLEVALRSHQLLVEKYGLNPKDIIFDPLVFPVGTGDEQYIGSAEATVEGIKLIKEALPDCLTILGVSNVSFGLPPVGREVLNAVYLYHCTQAGLDYAIVNTEKLERYASISEEEKDMAKKLLFETTDETLANFTAFYRGKKAEKKVEISNLSLEERLASYIVEGSKEGLIKDLDEALAKYEDPLDIINGPLMNGMDEVGKLFNNNELIVAEVLQSAEVMKASVAHLEPFMEKKEGDNGKGKIILATVKGDVHDIGKNLVEIILGNNGFKIVNLGIKVTSNEIIEAVKKEKPDAVGLSGLLVKSAQQMVLTAQDLRQQEISVPILVGGAALTRKFTDTKIAAEYDGLVLYAKDAMNGLELANRIVKPGEQEVLAAELKEVRAKKEEVRKRKPVAVAVAERPKRSEVSQTTPVFKPNDLEPHILRDYKLSHIEPYINMQMLLGRHLGLQGKVSRLLEEQDERALQLKEKVDDFLFRAKRDQLLQLNAVYRFFPAQSDGDDILIYDDPSTRNVIERFSFPRQQQKPYLCLADYLRPVSSGELDYVGFLAVTAGKGVREMAERAKEAGDYLESHLIQAAALETAEGFAERVHQLMRDRWGFPDHLDFTMAERFAAKYQGVRVSFGYPACPNLEDQAKLFKLIQPEKIGVELTDGFMMEPEASVTAMVFAHPEGRYFNVL
ncbi:5-methyltetrahydrofolate--homocysteine methyltransferase [Alkalihalobacillus alcalophilus ATCC 27647 = CGMCC 1.3604]|uniref:Methionine synthase n=1 Tax=Alkalihalobacillus alcalophilus ATCC 27647 = CGMCC 1.3604 TaxID=1218173 RepID=A0A094WN38_ALKAL|nr:methionine synthase [Alkalihalobacillus alcalophilus]KGA99169.1 methionine synthase [Alkalihalobacillus alcalophilus ATCC 27647 = CGMCC 1.3604]MED1562492.1 methionine synthase [Alkalihalobacillus alcalophilus]THG90646.1 5-methyltetrahydrofolate--homocysteine methyltransferase [Alkalihalobacillus alcalophilus ATCC 27647 = CGMCC 1.3604]